jgi:hypothetical protein
MIVTARYDLQAIELVEAIGVSQKSATQIPQFHRLFDWTDSFFFDENAETGPRILVNNV